MGPLGGFVFVSMREECFDYGAEALVVQGRPPAHGVGQVFDVAGRGREKARALARCGQAHGPASRLVAEIKGLQEKLTLRRAGRASCPNGLAWFLDEGDFGRNDSLPAEKRNSQQRSALFAKNSERRSRREQHVLDLYVDLARHQHRVRAGATVVDWVEELQIDVWSRTKQCAKLQLRRHA